MTLGPSNYLRSHQKHDEYLEGDVYLPFLNNEKAHDQMDTHKERFESLNSLTMIKFLDDPIIHPIESSWFGQIDHQGDVIPMESTKIFKDNTFGLRTLHE